MEGDALLIVQLSLAASLAAQGVTVDPTSIAIIGIYYYVEVPAPTSTSATTGRRLLVIFSACCHWLLEADLVPAALQSFLPRCHLPFILCCCSRILCHGY